MRGEGRAKVLFTCAWEFALKLFSVFSEVSGQPSVQQTLSLLLPLLGFFIQTLDPQLISQVRVASELVLCGRSLNQHLGLNPPWCGLLAARLVGLLVQGHLLSPPSWRAPLVTRPGRTGLTVGRPGAAPLPPGGGSRLTGRKGEQASLLHEVGRRLREAQTGQRDPGAGWLASSVTGETAGSKAASC